MDEPSRENEMFCPACGERIRRSANFCRHCGEPNRYGRGADWGPDEVSDDEGTTRRETNGKPAPRGPPREPAAPAGADETVPWRANLPLRTRRAKESTWRTVGVAIGLGVLGFLLLGIVSGIVAGIGIVVGLGFAVAVVIGTVVGQFLGFMGLSLWYLRYRGLDWERVKAYLGIRRPTLREVGLIFGAWIALLVGMVIVGGIGQVLLELLGAGDTTAEQESTQLFANNLELLPIAIVMMFLVVGPCEEILFRGIVQGRLRERLSPAPAIGITAVFFASIHATGFIGSIQGVVLGVTVLVVGGLVFGIVYEYTQNLVVVALLHGFHNSMILVFLYIGETSDFGEETATVALTALPL